MAWRCLASGLVALATALSAGTARADDEQQFELVKGLFYAGQYEEVVKRLAILLDPSNPACATVEGAPTSPQTCHIGDGVLVERCNEMHVVALVALKRQADADAVIEKILRANPAYSPDPGSLPATVVERIREIKDRLQKELEDKARKDADAQRKAALSTQKAIEDERKWVAEMTRLASKETIVEKRSRLIAFVPFGAGQFQNGDTGWGIFFAVSQALAGGASIGFAAVHDYWAGVDPTTRDPVTGRTADRDQLVAIANTTAIGNWVAFGTWAALTVAGVVQANVAFVPEVVTTRDRPVPKRPTPAVAVLPVVTPSPEGLSVGLTGVF